MISEREQAILEQNIARGELAKQLKKNRLLQELFISMKGDLIEQFESTGEGGSGSKERDEIWRQLKAVRDLEDRIENVYSEGEHSVGLLTKLKKRIQNVRQANRI